MPEQTNGFSFTIVSLIVLVLVAIIDWLGVEVANGQVESVVLKLVEIASAIGIYWGRYRQGDITAGGRKKTTTQ